MSKCNIYEYISEEKKKGVVSTRYPLDVVKAHNSNTGVWYNSEIIDDYNGIDKIELVTDINRISFYNFKIYLSICKYITENRYRLMKDFNEKYKQYDMKNKKFNSKITYDGIRELLNNCTVITVSFDEMLILLGKKVNKDNRRWFRNTTIQNVEEFTREFVSKITINDEIVTAKPMMTLYIRKSQKEIDIEIQDMFMYNMMNRCIYVQYTKELLECKSLEVIKLAMYLVSFKYNNRNSVHKNVVNVSTVLKKLGKTIEDYENFKVKDFTKTLRRTFENTLKKIDKSATFKLDLKGCHTISSIINRATFTYDIPVFKDGRMKYNNMVKISKSSCDDNTTETEIPFE